MRRKTVFRIGGWCVGVCSEVSLSVCNFGAALECR